MKSVLLFHRVWTVFSRIESTHTTDSGKTELTQDLGSCYVPMRSNQAMCSDILISGSTMTMSVAAGRIASQVSKVQAWVQEWVQARETDDDDDDMQCAPKPFGEPDKAQLSCQLAIAPAATMQPGAHDTHNSINVVQICAKGSLTSGKTCRIPARTTTLRHREYKAFSAACWPQKITRISSRCEPYKGHVPCASLASCNVVCYRTQHNKHTLTRATQQPESYRHA